MDDAVDPRIAVWFGHRPRPCTSGEARAAAGERATVYSATSSLNSIRRRRCGALRNVARRAILVARCDRSAKNFRLCGDFCWRSLDYQKQVCIIKLV